MAKGVQQSHFHKCLAKGMKSLPIPDSMDTENVKPCAVGARKGIQAIKPHTKTHC